MLGVNATGALMLLGVVPTAFLIWYVWPERRKPGVVWFIIAMCVGIAWQFLGGFNILIDDLTVSTTLYTLTEMVLSVGALCWFLLAVEYTAGKAVSKWAFPVLAVVPAVYIVGIAVQPTAFYSVESGATPMALRTDPEPAWFLAVSYNYLLAAFAGGLWLGEWFTSDGTRRRQTTLFLLATAIVFGTGILFSLTQQGLVESPVGVVFGPVGLIIGSGTIAYAMTEYQLFRFGPLAWETVIDGIDDGVVILDERDRVVETNPAVRDLLCTDRLVLGTSHPDATDFLGEYPELVARLADDDLRTELTLTVDGVERDVDLNITPVEYGRGSRGKAVVLRDITALKQRQRDLDLLKRVLTRVFRHNVRNDMAAIRGYAETIERQAEDELAAHASKILAQSDELIEQSEKARLIAEVIDADDAVVTTDLVPVIEESVAPYRTQYPAATITCALPDSVPVRAHRKLGLAIEQLVENGVVHTADPEVRVSVDTDGSRVGVVVADTGPGIPVSEIEALREGEESELRHGSGVGLWLVKWIAEYSGGELELEGTDSGTRGIIWLQRAESR